LNKVSASQSQRLPRLGLLLVDADVNPLLLPYLRAVGFNVKFVHNVKVNVHDDPAIIRYARKHNRILICHDRYKDRKTRIRVFQEIYEHGGQAIQVSSGSGQDPLTSLGKILLHRNEWVEFFKENDGIVLVHATGMKRMPRSYLIRQLQRILGDNQSVIGDIPKRSPRSSKGHRQAKTVANGQLTMPTVL